MSPSKLYYFKVTARNSQGYGTDSSSVAILAATIPSTPQAPITQL